MVYKPEEITLIMGGVGALLASVIYTLKNVKHLRSACLGCDIIEVLNDDIVENEDIGKVENNLKNNISIV
tara:strand:- start:6159 stop:6368 length:210 start_codon:yes stop_codon:yes gene_type:complete